MVVLKKPLSLYQTNQLKQNIMNSLLEMYQSNLESVTETAQSQAIELAKLKIQMADLQAANEKLESKLSNANSTLQAYRNIQN